MSALSLAKNKGRRKKSAGLKYWMPDTLRAALNLHALAFML
jgi:hypothetical protein